MNGRSPRQAFPVAVIAAAVVVASALLLGRAHGAGATSSATTGPRRGVVIVNTNLAYENNSAAGTGVVLTSSGEVLTNNHVIRGASTIRVTDPSDGLTFSAKVLGYSVSKDVALLQLHNPRGLKVAAIGNSSTARVGQHVTAVGNAGGTGSLTTVTGRVTGLGQSISVSDDQGGSNRLIGLIETNAPLEPGDSGGPLLAGGRVIGLNAAASSIISYDGPREGYSIPINRAVSIAHQIESGRRSTTVHVGPDCVPRRPDRAARLPRRLVRRHRAIRPLRLRGRARGHPERRRDHACRRPGGQFGRRSAKRHAPGRSRQADPPQLDGLLRLDQHGRRPPRGRPTAVARRLRRLRRPPRTRRAESRRSESGREHSRARDQGCSAWSKGRSVVSSSLERPPAMDREDEREPETEADDHARDGQGIEPQQHRCLGQ